MPSKYSIKSYVENSYYHIFNRGVEKRDIFLDKQDYSVFLSYFKLYLSPIPESETFWNFNNFYQEIDLIAYCLMPNHFHLLIKQYSKSSMDHFMRSLGTKYSMYFNKKYNRVGPLYQGRYKAVRIQTDEQLIYLTKYIHRNPVELFSKGTVLINYSYSSYRNYLGKINQIWVKPEEILDLYSSKYPSLRYKAFVEETDLDEAIISNYIIER